MRYRIREDRRLGMMFLMSLSGQCSCHHEAGHAVAWVANGYSLRLVVGHSAEGLSPEKRSVWEEALRDPNNHSAYWTQCQRRLKSGGGGTIPETKNGPLPEHLRTHEFTQSCPTCTTLFTSYLSCMFAGGAATSILLPTEHATSQMSDDRAQIRGKLQKAFTTDERQRTIVYDEAEQQACSLIKRESDAVRSLAKELLDRGALCGCEAERIIREHLSSS
jgi:hypothetical protein